MPDGGLLAGGGASEAEQGVFLVGKLRGDGTYDPSFGEAGALAGEPGLLPQKVLSVASTTDATRFLAYANRGSGRLRRLTSTGETDATFHATAPQLGRATNWQFVSGSRILGSGGGTLIRLLPDGALDASFGKAGAAALPFAPDETVVLEDGAILAAGTNHQFVTLVRLLEDGNEDIDFGRAGRVVESFVGIVPTIRLAIRHNRIVIAAIAAADGFGPDDPIAVTLRRYFP